jgi:hypothetical protein
MQFNFITLDVQHVTRALSSELRKKNKILVIFSWHFIAIKAAAMLLKVRIFFLQSNPKLKF